MEWTEENRFKILKKLSSEEGSSHNELKKVYPEFMEVFGKENLWLMRGLRNNEIFLITNNGRGILKHLKNKKRNESFNQLLLIIATIAAMIGSIPVVRTWISK